MASTSHRDRFSKGGKNDPLIPPCGPSMAIAGLASPEPLFAAMKPIRHYRIDVALAQRKGHAMRLKSQGFQSAAGLFHRECGKDGDNSSVVPRILPE